MQTKQNRNLSNTVLKQSKKNVKDEGGVAKKKNITGFVFALSNSKVRVTHHYGMMTVLGVMCYLGEIQLLG